MPDITIITPSYNQGNFLERTIQSVHTHSEINIEHIVMDGGSTDETTEILKKYQNQIIAFSEHDNGQAHAVNKGFKLAQSEIIGWLNSDDIYYPSTLNFVIEFFKQNPTINVLYGQANFIDEYDRIIGQYPTLDWNPNSLKEICFISQPAVFFRKKIFQLYGHLDEKLNYCMDYEYWLRMTLAGEKFAYKRSHVFAGTRIHASTKTVQGSAQATNEAISMLYSKLGYTPGTYLLLQAYLSEHTRLRQLLLTVPIAVRNSIKINGLLMGVKTILCSPTLYRRIFTKLIKR